VPTHWLPLTPDLDLQTPVSLEVPSAPRAQWVLLTLQKDPEPAANLPQAEDSPQVVDFPQAVDLLQAADLRPTADCRQAANLLQFLLQQELAERALLLAAGVQPTL